MAVHNEYPRRRRATVSSPPALAPTRWRARLAGLRTGIFRGLLVLLILAHYVLLVVVLLRSIEVAWQVVGKGPDATLSQWSLAIGLAGLALLVAERLWVALPGLVTPLYDQKEEWMRGTKLNRDMAPALFSRVTEVARRMGSPTPDEIWLLPEANCFAFEDRRFSISTHRKLVLALGLPQILILTEDELSVIVAHELAHVLQQDTTRAVFFYRFSHLLERSLGDASCHPWRWVNPTLWLEWVSDKAFKMLFAPVQKGQEILADCRSAAAFGGDLARQTLLRDWLVSNQFEALVNQRQEASDSGKQLDTRTVYQQFLDEWQEISHNGQLYLRERLEELEQESYWDTHPALRHRLAAVSAYPNFGADDGRPASGMLSDIPDLITRMGLGPRIKERDPSNSAVVA